MGTLDDVVLRSFAEALTSGTNFMKICLVRGPSIVGKTAFIAPLTPSIGLAYIAASLRDAGHEVMIIDAVGENPRNSIPYTDFLILRGIDVDEIVARIPRDVEMIGISEMFSSQWSPTRALINAIGEVFPNTFTVGGGEHFSAAPELSLDQCPTLDACAFGEGEEVAVELADTLERGGDIKTVAGLMVRSKNGYIKTGPRGRIRNIDEIPRPAWDLVPLNNYLDDHLGFGVDLGRSIPMLASRGCPYQCTFCSSPNFWGTRWLARDPKIVVNEIEDYVTSYQVENIDFYDLTAIVKRDWIIDFCNELINRKLNITWQLPSGTRSEVIDLEVANLLFQSGCRNLSYAPESGSEKMLVKIKKKIKLKTMQKSLRDAYRAGLSIKLNFIIGLPDETHMDVLKTFWLMAKFSWYGAQDVGVAPFAPYPGSPLYSRLLDEGKIDHSNAYFDTLASVNFTRTVSYCDAISYRWLRFYNLAGFFLFYGSNYVFRPWRLVRTIRNLIVNKHETRGEMALRDMLERMGLAPAVRARDT